MLGPRGLIKCFTLISTITEKTKPIGRPHASTIRIAVEEEVCFGQGVTEEATFAVEEETVQEISNGEEAGIEVEEEDIVPEGEVSYMINALRIQTKPFNFRFLSRMEA